jgi:hypothetical protein
VFVFIEDWIRNGYEVLVCGEEPEDRWRIGSKEVSRKNQMAKGSLF